MARQNLFAPWRISYVKSIAGEPARDPAEGACFLCEANEQNLSDNDRAERLILLCDQRGCLMLNRYPYTNGHVLVAPAEHVGDISDLNRDQRLGLMDLIDLGNRLLNNALNPQGVNVGLNMGRCAGAGVPGHVHFHIVPRWHGDVNFMDVVGQVRVIPQALEQTYQTLRATLPTLEP